MLKFRIGKVMITEKKRKILSATAILLFILFCGVVGVVVGKPMLQFASEPQKFRFWVENHGIWGKIAFVFMIVFQVVIALVPGEPFEIAAGYAFGAVLGTLLSMIGIFLGSMLVFLLVRKFGIKLVEVFFTYEKIKSLQFLQNRKKVSAIVFLMFFLPGTPKDLLTYFVGLTDIKTKHFLLIATIARIPSLVTSTVGGSLLGVQKYTFAIIVFVVTFIISVVGWLIYNHLTKEESFKKGE